MQKAKKQSPLFNLDYKDFIRGAITAVLTGIAFGTFAAFLTSGFDVFTADWTQIFHLAVNGAFGAFIGYLIKRFFSDDSGQFLGKSAL